jgi:CheY-like chemotaxis protein
MVRSGESIVGIRSFIARRGDYLIGQHAVEKVRLLVSALKDVQSGVLVEEREMWRRLSEKGKEPAPPERGTGAENKGAVAAGNDAARVSRILLVEDDEDTQKMAIRFLEGASYEVTAAMDGIDALMRLGHMDFDLIISDIAMPNLDGFKLMEMLSQKGIDTPLVFLTGSMAEQDELHGLELGAADYMRKPIRKELLLSRVRNALSKRAGG